MIYTQITGGLGNQMFDYAIGYALAKDNNDKLTADISAYKFSPRPFVLDSFEITGAVKSMFPALNTSKPCRMIARLLRIIASNRYGSCKWMKESMESRNAYGNYDFSYKKSLYLEGYWQHYKYFDRHYKDICKEFSLKSEHISNGCQKLVDDALTQNSIAMHIRKGDYEAAWVLKDSFYHDAIKIMNEKLDNPHYYLFCEDIEYAKEHYGYLTNATFVTGNYSLTDLEEFHLISKCKHQIIANSSFSWWAAYLNSNPSKIVIAPKYLHWTKEFYPDNWIVLDC
ncbi:MAG: alpha-1,2-fucosyltransferase [Lachnospiraceae bacterium]|nr:alpha-1,2-fucosyltransferase [Lachnospiraceae bacterium]